MYNLLTGELFQSVKPFNRSAPFTPSSFLRRDAGEDEGGGGDNLNGFNCWNCFERIHLYTTSGKPAITATVTVTVKAVKCQYSVTLPMSAS